MTISDFLNKNGFEKCKDFLQMIAYKIRILMYKNGVCIIKIHTPRHALPRSHSLPADINIVSPPTCATFYSA